ncbi:inactive hydroxysteroid dehydrogenase-like protein 1 [Centruroides vittatus]|uniref:inactive hydroxysteroid dehydrogenase-like protein 1 n=1 Tax=Centruroides vittatus TaxID=120091 RepID=UPI00350F2F18
MAAVDQAVLLFREINRRLKVYEEILAVVGLLYVSKKLLVISWKVLRGFRVFVLSRVVRNDPKKFGRWAVVTGATDGIGKAYGRELASRGLNVVLISRNLERLKKTAEELEKSFGVDTLVIQADFFGADVYSSIRDRLRGIDVAVLVNNVGVMYDTPERLLDVPERKLWELININVASVVMMTRMVLPQMLDRKGGYIVNVSSIASFYPLPLMAVYSASKAFVDWFSRALHYEYSGDGIVVQSLIPSYVSTKLVQFSAYLREPSFLAPDAATFCRSAVATLGVADRTTGYWSHGLQYAVYECIPQWLWYLSSWWLQKALYRKKTE